MKTSTLIKELIIFDKKNRFGAKKLITFKNN